MSNVTLFSKQELPDFLQNAGVSELTKQIAGRARVKRIVPKNGIFRKVVGGEEMGKVKGNLDVVIVNTLPQVGRIFYAQAWSADAEPTAPDCFSNDGRSPDPKANNPQSSRCDSCDQNTKGSGQGQSKACRYSRRIAVLLAEDFDTNLEGEVYQMNLASKSLFGAGDANNAHTFESYAKYLSSNGRSIDQIVTQISFNENNDNQSVLFTPTRYINRHEYEVSQRVADTPETKALISMTPSQADGVVKKPVAIEAPVPTPTPKPVPKAVVEAEVEEPVKRPSKKVESTEVPAKKNLASVVSAWSSED